MARDDRTVTYTTLSGMGAVWRLNAPAVIELGFLSTHRERERENNLFAILNQTMHLSKCGSIYFLYHVTRCCPELNYHISFNDQCKIETYTVYSSTHLYHRTNRYIHNSKTIDWNYINPFLNSSVRRFLRSGEKNLYVETTSMLREGYSFSDQVMNSLFYSSSLRQYRQKKY